MSIDGSSRVCQFLLLYTCQHCMYYLLLDSIVCYNNKIGQIHDFYRNSFQLLKLTTISTKLLFVLTLRFFSSENWDRKILKMAEVETFREKLSQWDLLFLNVLKLNHDMHQTPSSSCSHSSISIIQTMFHIKI